MIFELTGKTGELIIEMEQELKFGAILNHGELENGKNMIFFEVHSITPSKFHYSIDSNSIPFAVSLIIFRPENLQGAELNIKIDYTSVSSCNKTNELCTKNLIIEPGTSYLMYILIGVGSVLVIVIIIIIIWCVVKKNKNKYPKINRNRPTVP